MVPGWQLRNGSDTSWEEQQLHAVTFCFSPERGWKAAWQQNGSKRRAWCLDTTSLSWLKASMTRFRQLASKERKLTRRKHFLWCLITLYSPANSLREKWSLGSFLNLWHFVICSTSLFCKYLKREMVLLVIEHNVYLRTVYVILSVIPKYNTGVICHFSEFFLSTTMHHEYL